MGLGYGVGRKGREEGEGREERAGSGRLCVWSLQAPASAAAAAAATILKNSPERPASEEGSQARRTNSGSRKQSPGTATCKRGRKPSRDRTAHTSTLAHRHRASSSASALPPPGGGMGGGRDRRSEEEPQKGFPACVNVVLASEVNARAARGGTLANCRRSGPSYGGRGARAGGGAPRVRRRPNPWVCGCAAEAERRRRRRAKSESGAFAGAARLPERRGCVWSAAVRHAEAERELAAAGRTRQPGARPSVAFLRASSASSSALPSCVSPGVHQYGQRREAPRGRRHPASSLPRELPAPPPGPARPRMPVIIADSAY